MKVTLKDLRKLEDDVSEQIQELTLVPNTDLDRLAELRTLSFNISMLFLRHSMEKDSTEIELGQNESDRLIIEAMKPIRVRDVEKKVRSFDYIDNISDMAMELIQRIDELKAGMKGSRSILFENIMYRLNTSRDWLSDIARLKDDDMLLNVWKKNRIQGVQLAASVLGQSKSTRKSEAARENGKKGGRPKKGESRKILDEKGVFIKEKTVPTRKKSLAKAPKSAAKAGAKKKSG